MEAVKEATKRVLYTAKVHTTGGRARGVARSDDGHLEIKLTTPGTGGTGTNPEQLFAAGWSACYEGAMDIVANKMKVTLPEGTAIDAEVDLCLTGMDFSIQGRLNINLPGMDMEVAQKLAEQSHKTCPYSLAIKGNVDVKTTITV